MVIRRSLGTSVVLALVMLSMLPAAQVGATELNQTQPENITATTSNGEEGSKTEVNMSTTQSHPQTVADAPKPSTAPSILTPTPTPATPSTGDSQNNQNTSEQAPSMELILGQKPYHQEGEIDLKVKTLNLKPDTKLKLKITKLPVNPDVDKSLLIDIEYKIADEVDLAKYIKDAKLDVGTYQIEVYIDDGNNKPIVSNKLNLVVLPKQITPIKPDTDSKPITPPVQPKKEQIAKSEPLKTLEPVKADTRLSTVFSTPHIFAVASSQRYRTAVALPIRSSGSNQTVKPTVTSEDSDSKSNEKSITLPTVTSQESASQSEQNSTSQDKEQTGTDWQAIGIGAGILGAAAAGLYFIGRVRK